MTRAIVRSLPVYARRFIAQFFVAQQGRDGLVAFPLRSVSRSARCWMIRGFPRALESLVRDAAQVGDVQRIHRRSWSDSVILATLPTRR